LIHVTGRHNKTEASGALDQEESKSGVKLSDIQLWNDSKRLQTQVETSQINSAA
jgi:hypothetical protein